MPAHRISFRWSKSPEGSPTDAANGLSERLRPVAQDRAAEAQEVVRETASLLRSWILERPRNWEPSAALAGQELELGCAEWVANQSWRGSCANFMHSLRACFGGLRDSAELREGLVEELDTWMTEAPGKDRGSLPSAAPSPMPNPRDVVPHALRTLERGDEVLIHGRSAAIVESLAAAQHAGLFPRVTLAVSGADQSGKRTARQLTSHGIPVRLLWDAALQGAVCAADQIWLGTEGVGPGAFLGLLGSGALLAEANRQEIPIRVLCTSDVCLPGGQMERPSWGDTETWNLWSQGPEGVELESQPFEINDAENVTGWITEEGPTDLATICTRHLVLEPAAPCDAAAYTEHDSPPGSAQAGR